MHKMWCGKPCKNCKHPCQLDEEIYCSPDCENLGPNGEMDPIKCRACDAYIASIEDSEREEKI